MLVRVDPVAAEPLYAQIAAQVRAAIGKGRLAEGEQLPPARELADALGVNMHTVPSRADRRDGRVMVERRRREGVRAALAGVRRRGLLVGSLWSGVKRRPKKAREEAGTTAGH